MHIPQKKFPLIREFIRRVETEDFSDATLPSVTPLLNEILNGNYLALMFMPNRFSRRYHLLSNNPQEFLDVYLQLLDKEFLIQHMVDTGDVTLLHRLATPEMRRVDEFCVEVQRIRPVSDVCYVPLRIDGYLAGYFATGRAGIKSPIYSSNDVEIFAWLSSFLSESFRKSLYYNDTGASSALVNGFGEVVFAGERIKAALKELMGFDCWESARYRGTPNQAAFSFWIESILTRSCRIDDLVLTIFDREYRFAFKRLPMDDYRRYSPQVPQLRITFTETRNRSKLIDADLFGRRHELTPKETKILHCIYKGLSNAEIGRTLGCEESTVKRQLNSIFSKCRVKNRMQLVFALAG